jgi:sensor domain CHASE-containing protein
MPAMLTMAARRLWLPVLVAAAIAVGGFVLADNIADNEAELIYSLVESEAARIRSELAEQLWQRRLAIQNLAARMEHTPGITEDAWQAEAARLLVANLQFRAIEWVEPSLAVRWSAPATERIPAANLDPNDDELRSAELQRLEDRPEASVSRTFVIAEGHRQVLICAPMFAAGRGAGFIVGVLRVRDLVDVVAEGGLARGYTVALFEEPYLIYGATKQETGPEKVWAVDNDIDLGDHAWRVQVWPSAELLEIQRSSNADVARIAGALLGILLGAALYLAQAWRKRARRRERGEGGEATPATSQAAAPATGASGVVLKADATASAAPTPEH